MAVSDYDECDAEALVDSEAAVLYCHISKNKPHEYHYDGWDKIWWKKEDDA
jgi:hypothetical protein